MKRICILSTVNLKHMTMISLYTRYMDINNISYDIIYIDKYCQIEDNNADNVYKFDLYINRKWSLPRKFLHYWSFKKYAQELLLSNKYDFIITWNIFTAFMFQDILNKYYYYKYCLNIRDVCSKKIFIAYYYLKRAIAGSAFSTISSDGFRKVLPPYNYITIHSMNMEILRECTPHLKLKPKGKPINIIYVGYMCYYENCYKLIDELGNDERYVLKFCGQGSEPIECYARYKGLNNVICQGRFEPNETAAIINDADIIYNLYGFGNVNLDTALSIKLYYAIYLNIPILVFSNTYMEEISKKCGIGYSIEKNGFKGLGDKLYAWYHSLDQSDIVHKCASFREDVLRSHNNLKELMDEFIK